MMRKPLCLIATITIFTFNSFTADAAWRSPADERLNAVSIGVGAASTAAFFAFNDWHWKWNSSRHGITALGAGVLTTVGCGALSPIVATAVINRPLTYREAHVLIADCIIPFIGGWLVNDAYNKHIFWAPDEKPIALRPARKRLYGTGKRVPSA
jgi:hypothetical protein